MRVHPYYALEKACQWLKYFVYVFYGCMKWSEVGISLKHDDVASFPLLKSSEPDSPNLGATWPVQGIRVHRYALETVYQWRKHFVSLLWMYEVV
jgi:hypothetical protein